MTWALIITVTEIAWIAFLALWIVLERRSPTATIAWVLGLSFLPLIGVPVYLLLGPRRLQRKRMRYSDARARIATSVVPAPPCEELDALVKGRRASRPSSVGSTGDSLMELVARATGIPPSKADHVEVLRGGPACYAAMETAFREAKHHIHLEYYIFEDDAAGRRIRDVLVERARDGIAVRLLVDAIGSAALGTSFLEPLREAGAQVAFFNAVVGRRVRPLINFRTHRKIAVVDGRVGFTGGINVSAEYLPDVAGDASWRDTHIMVRGAAVRGLSLMFLEDWQFTTGAAPRDEMVCPALEPSGSYVVQIVGSGPDDDVHAIHKLFFAAIGAATSRVWITTPYFVPDAPILTALETAALRGVDVRVLVPKLSHNDLKVVGMAASTYYPGLMERGVRFFEYQPRMVHAKTLIMDDVVAVVGTANMDNRSFRLNFEVAAAMYDKRVNDELARHFVDDVTEAKELKLAELKRQPLWWRLAESTARLASPWL